MSLRNKFLLLMVLVPSICLVIFLAIAIRTFISDKVGYVFESNLNLLTNSGMQLNSAFKQIQDASGNFTDIKTWPELAKSVFVSENNINVHLVDPSGAILDSTDDKNIGKNISEVLSHETLDRLVAEQRADGSFEVAVSLSDTELVSFTRLADFKYFLISNTNKSNATRSSLVFLLKGFSAFAMLVSLAVILSIVFSDKLTESLVQLASVMGKYGNGDFTVRAEVKSQDEVGKLSKHFNEMSDKINVLIKEQQAKTKIEAELELAQKVQKSFLPEANFKQDLFEFCGYYEPATHCSGDWWTYFRVGDHFVVCLGDVTGHGVQSALVTSAARATLSVIQRNYQGPAQAMHVLNQVIAEATRGELNMTFVILEINAKTNDIVYCNASHEAPIIFSSTDPSRVEDLIEIGGARLGENINSVYKESKSKVQNGDLIFIYSDGLVDLKNAADKSWGERSLKRQIKKIDRATTARLFVRDIESETSKFRQSHPLVDDLSFCCVRWG